MARHVFDKLGIQPAEASESDEPQAPVQRRKPIVKGGATSAKYINAATQGGADRTYQEISVDQIQDSVIRDRIDVKEDLDSLVESIRENGQQIPILVRVVQGDKPYEIVVGRRRLAATRKLGLPRIKAFVAKMSDRDAFLAQGIENSARLETSFIERARAASQGVEAGHEAQDIAQFLNISPTLVSFMIRTFNAIGEDLVVLVGPARGIGRRKWDALVAAMKRKGITPAKAAQMVDPEIGDSVERFEALLKAVASDEKAPPLPAGRRSMSKTFLDGGLSTWRKPGQFIVKSDKALPPELLDTIQETIEEKIQEIVTEFQQQKEE